MALTNDAFRDPRRLFTVKALTGFFVSGRKDPVKPGEVLQLPRSQAAELLHGKKAVLHEGGAAQAAPPVVQSVAPPAPPATATGTSAAVQKADKPAK